MTPETFFCWWEESPTKGFRFLRRFRSPTPRPEETLPWSRLLRKLLLPTVLLALGAILRRFSPVLGLVWLALGTFIATSILCHSLFTVVSWNRRAARIRSSIPPAVPARSLWTAMLILVYAVLFDIATPYVLLTSLERAHGALRWKATRDTLIAKGERLGFWKLAGWEVPDDQNAATIPLFRELMRTNSAEVMETNGGIRIPTAGQERMKVFSRPEEQLPERSRKIWRPTTLEDWSTAFRVVQDYRDGKTNVVSKSDSTSKRRVPPRADLPEYPAAPAGVSAATVVLTALQVAKPELDPIREASGRPFCRFDYAWDEGFQMLLPNLGALKRIQNHLDLRIWALIADGQTNAAFDETLVALRVSDWLRNDPLLISQLVRIAQAQIATESIWHGIAAHCWTDAQLQEFQTQLAQRDSVAGMALALEGERNGAIQTMDRWVRNPKEIFQVLDPNGTSLTASADSLEQTFFATFLPRGWIRQNQSTLALETQRHIEAARRLRGGTPTAEWRDLIQEAETWDSEAQARYHDNPSPYTAFARQLGSALGKSLANAVRSQVMNRCAITGCALERYRLRNGAYPETLEALVPDFLAAVPIDPMDGQPIRYAQNDNGLFRLWSIGDDRQDQKGRRSKEGSHQDWTWPASYTE